MMTKEGSTKTVNFMTPGAGVLVFGRGHVSYSENALFLKKSSSLLPCIIRQTKSRVMMTKEGSTKKYNFHDSLGRGFCARVWPYKSY